MNRKPSPTTRVAASRPTSRKDTAELRRQLSEVTARQNELKERLHRLDAVTVADAPRMFQPKPAAPARQRAWTVPSESDEDDSPRYRRTRMQERLEKRQRSWQAMVALGLVAFAFGLGTGLIQELKRDGIV